jgi:hypothetical protein
MDLVEPVILSKSVIYLTGKVEGGKIGHERAQSAQKIEKEDGRSQESLFVRSLIPSLSRDQPRTAKTKQLERIRESYFGNSPLFAQRKRGLSLHQLGMTEPSCLIFRGNRVITRRSR